MIFRMESVRPFIHNKKTAIHYDSGFSWWGRTDSNHRSETQQIYSLSPLATRELPRIRLISQAEHAYYSMKLLFVKSYF